MHTTISLHRDAVMGLRFHIGRPPPKGRSARMAPCSESDTSKAKRFSYVAGLDGMIGKRRQNRGGLLQRESAPLWQDATEAQSRTDLSL